MFHFEIIDNKNKIIFEDKDIKTILKNIISFELKNVKSDDTQDVIFEDSVGNILQTISEKYLKHILGIETISRKTAKLDKSIETFKKLKQTDISTITLKNKAHEGIVTIWDEENIETSDSEIDKELEDAMCSDYDTSSDESVEKEIKPSNSKIEFDKLKKENERLLEEIKILKSFVTKYRTMLLKINEEVSKIELK